MRRIETGPITTHIPHPAQKDYGNVGSIAAATLHPQFLIVPPSGIMASKNVQKGNGIGMLDPPTVAFGRGSHAENGDVNVSKTGL